ncbi:hypothetical protein [Nocardia tengchongensis]
MSDGIGGVPDEMVSRALVTIGSPNYYGVDINKAHRPDCKKLADDIQN